ncbi:MAG: helix-turn-helix transcriptional regulator, partial [Micrococcales bacterium]
DLLASSQPAASPPTIFFEVGTVGADVSILRRAVLSELQISCSYTNQRGEESVRTLEPFRLDPRGAVWYLKAYCPLSRQIKSFRLDRMRQIVLSDHPWSEVARAAFTEFDQDEDRLYVPGEGDTDVVVEVDPEAYELVSEFTTISEPNTSSNGVIRVTIKVGHLPNLGHLIAKYGGAARVVSPPIAREMVRNYALAALGQKNKDFERIEDED